MASPLSPARLTLFGAPRLTRDGVLLGPSLKRGFALLAYLAISARPVPRSVLSHLLWPDAGEETGRSRLRRLVYTLQRVIPDSITGDSSTLCLVDGAIHVDLVEVAGLARRAVSARDPGVAMTLLDAYPTMFQPLLQGLDIDSRDFDAWRELQAVDHEHLLVRLLRLAIDGHIQRGNPAGAVPWIEQLISMDRCGEPAYVSLMEARAGMGDAAGVEAAFMRCAEELRSEFGSKPGNATERAYLELIEPFRQPARLSATREALAIRFAHARSGTVAYASIGEGPETLVIIPGFISHIEIGWEQPRIRSMLESLALTHRVIVFDCRGVGLSERIGSNFSAESAASDVLAILDDAGIGKAWMFGSSEGGPVAIHLAAHHGGRVRGLALFGAMAKGSSSDDYPWALAPAAFDTWMGRMLASWGGASDLEIFAPTEVLNPSMRAWWARMLRHATTPASMQNTLRALRDVDVRQDLGRIEAPTLILHREGDRAVRFEAGEYLSRHVPDSRFIPLPGADHWWWCGETNPVLDALKAFVGGAEQRKA